MATWNGRAQRRSASRTPSPRESSSAYRQREQHAYGAELHFKVIALRDANPNGNFKSLLPWGASAHFENLARVKFPGLNNVKRRTQYTEVYEAPVTAKFKPAAISA